MTISQIRKCFIKLSVQTQSHVHKPNVCYSISTQFFYSSKAIEPIPISDYLINQHHFSPTTALKASSTIPLVRNPQNTDSVFHCLKETGFSKTHIETIINKYPKVLSIHLETLQRKIKIFHDSGFSPSDTVDIVFNNPWILSWSTDDRLRSTFSRLRSLLRSTGPIRRLLSKLRSWSIRTDGLMANIEYLNKTCGISSHQIKTYMLANPRLFVSNPERLAEVVRRVDATGFDRNSRSFLQAIQAMAGLTVETWEIKLRFFRELGLSEAETLAMFRRAPRIFSLSVEKIKENMDVMIVHGKVDVSFVAKHSELLGYSGNRRVKPRLDVMEILEKEDLLKTRPKLTSFVVISRNKFLEKYVLPYSNVIPLRVLKEL